jgi:antitoxin HicB
MTRTCTVILDPDPEDGGYTVLVPALPGCVTDGATLEEVLANAREAISLTLEDLAAHDEPILEDRADVRLERVSASLPSHSP